MLLRDQLIADATVYIDMRIEEFWSRVNKNGPVHPVLGTPCWPWTGGTVVRGYGQFWLGKQEGVHRIAWRLLHGEVPGRLHVLHRCDNTICVNAQEHLFLGTHQQNMEDRDRKGRRRPPQGAEHGHSKLTEEQVLKIRELRATGIKNIDIAKMFGVSQSMVSKIGLGHYWRHLQ